MNKNSAEPQGSEEEIRILQPDYSLKKKIGEDVDLKKIFSAENITKAQAVIETHKESFLEWVKNDMNTLEDCYKQAKASLAESAPHMQKLAKTAFVIKSQAGTFGYALATQIAKSLDDFCNRDFKPQPEHLTVVRKHIDVLQSIFLHNIVGDGGALGDELGGNLRKLVAKYRA